MNIEDTQKVNRLAKELLMHGLAASSGDAMAKAEEMVYGRNGAEQRAAQQVVERENQEMRYLQNSVRQLSNDVSRILSEIASLRQSHEQLKSYVSESRAQKPAAPETAARPMESNKEAPQPKPESDAVFKGFSPEDVAIDKVFYFGKR